MCDLSNLTDATSPLVSLAIDVVLFTSRGAELAVLLVERLKRRGRGSWMLPSHTLRGGESLDEAAARIARAAAGVAPSFLDQAKALGGSRRGANTRVNVAYFGLVPGASAGAHGKPAWVGLSDLSQLEYPDRQAIDVALTAMRARVDQQPIAFRLLPPAFTLGELQTVYELLLGRRLHKASFRRSLNSSALVQATDAWRSEGRGRPAQLFRYSPPPRERQLRGVRFALLAD